MTFSIENFKPTGDWVYVKLEESHETDSGIYWREEDFLADGDVKDSVNEDLDIGYIVAKGPKANQVTVGDRVLFGKLYGDPVVLPDNKKYLKMFEENIISTLPPAAEVRPGKPIDYRKKLREGEEKNKIRF